MSFLRRPIKPVRLLAWDVAHIEQGQTYHQAAERSAAKGLISCVAAELKAGVRRGENISKYNQARILQEAITTKFQEAREAKRTIDNYDRRLLERCQNQCRKIMLEDVRGRNSKSIS